MSAETVRLAWSFQRWNEVQVDNERHTLTLLV